MSCPAVPLRPDPAPPATHNGPGGLSGLRHLLRPQADPDVLAHLAQLRATEPEWPPPVPRADPTVRNPQRGAGDGRVRSALVAVERCAGPRREVPCLPVHRYAVTCPRCRRPTPAVERRTGPRPPVCICYPALCAHFPTRRPR